MQLISTETLAANDRLDYWRDVVCDNYIQLQCDPPPGATSIDGRIRLQHASTLLWSEISASAQTVRRTAGHIAQASEDFCVVSIMLRGQAVASQDGRQSLMKPGDFVLIDTTRPYELKYEAGFDLCCLMLPGNAIRTALRDSENLTATVVDGRRGAGHLVLGMVNTLSAQIESLAPQSAAAVADGVTHILLAGLASMRAGQEPTAPQRAAVQREQIRQLVRRQLRDPSLNVASIAQQLKVSPSSLHRAWAGEPTGLGEWIWTLRLDAARRELADPALRARSIGEVAFGCGFNDVAHFSRAFKGRFGCTPSDAREAARGPRPAGRRVAPGPGTGTGTRLAA
jgi:AraC-like DNA-binding protein